MLRRVKSIGCLTACAIASTSANAQSFYYFFDHAEQMVDGAEEHIDACRYFLFEAIRKPEKNLMAVELRSIGEAKLSLERYARFSWLSVNAYYTKDGVGWPIPEQMADSAVNFSLECTVDTIEKRVLALEIGKGWDAGSNAENLSFASGEFGILKQLENRTYEVGLSTTQGKY